VTQPGAFFMDYLPKDKIIELFNRINAGGVYQKQGVMLARPAQPGETVITVVAGRIETLKPTFAGDWVIQNIMINSSAERYPISGEKFVNRYDRSDEVLMVEGQTWFKVSAKGQIIGGFYTGPTVKFEAPWGEDMILEEGDFLGTPYPNKDPNDIYRVARMEFFQTYGETPAFYEVEKLDA